MHPNNLGRMPLAARWCRHALFQINPPEGNVVAIRR
jgi:hypothetical protein